MPVKLPTGSTGLPPLGGRLFASYRLAWWALVAIALATLAGSWLDTSAAMAIWLLRLTKGAVLIAVSAILYRRRRTDPVAAMLALAFLLWTISSSANFAGISTWPALVDRLRFLFFALALLLFPDGEWQPHWTKQIAIATAATFALGIGEALGLFPTRVFLPIAIACVVAALGALMQRYRALPAGAPKQQLKWVMLGLVVGILLILFARAGALLTANMTMPFVGAILLEGSFQLGIVTIALGFLTSLLRYRLYDAEAAISRSAVYAMLTLTLVGTFAGSEALIELLGQRYFGMAIGNVSGAVAAAVAAMLLTPLHGRISDWAEHRFQHDLARLKRELPDLLVTFSAGASIKRLAAAVLPALENAVQSTRIALLVDGQLVATQGIKPATARKLLSGWQPSAAMELIRQNDEDAFPLQMALRCPLGGIRGWLLLGPRPDGSYYGKDDLAALTEIGPPLQRTVVVVAEREDEQTRQRRLVSSFHRSIAMLTDRLDKVEQANRELFSPCPDGVRTR